MEGDCSIELKYDKHSQPAGSTAFAPVFYSGTRIRGRISVTVTPPTIAVRTLSLHIFGNSLVRWQSEIDERFIRHEKVLIDHCENLLQSDNSKSIILSSGTHIFPVLFTLPSDLPSTYNGQFLTVSYIIRVSLQGDENADSEQIDLTEPIVVFQQPKVNLHPIRIKHGTEKNKKQLTSIKASIQRQAFQQGEIIFINGEFVNLSHESITCIEARLSLKVSVSNDDGSKKTEIKEVSHVADHVLLGKRHGRLWKNMSLTIPQYVPSTSSPPNHDIDVRYCIILLIKRLRNELSLEFKIPIVVGAEIPVTLKTIRCVDKVEFDQSVEHFLSTQSECNTVRSAVSSSTKKMIQTRMETEPFVIRSNPLAEFSKEERIEESRLRELQHKSVKSDKQMLSFDNSLFLRIEQLNYGT